MAYLHGIALIRSEGANGLGGGQMQTAAAPMKGFKFDFVGAKREYLH